MTVIQGWRGAWAWCECGWTLHHSWISSVLDAVNGHDCTKE